MSPAVRRHPLLRVARRCLRGVARHRRLATACAPEPGALGDAERAGDTVRRRPRHRRPDADAARDEPAGRGLRSSRAVRGHLLGGDARVAQRGEPAAERPRRDDELDAERRRARTAHLRHPDHPLLVGAAERVRARDQRLGRRSPRAPRRCWTRCAPAGFGCESDLGGHPLPDRAADRRPRRQRGRLRRDRTSSEATAGSRRRGSTSPPRGTPKTSSHALGLISAGCR